MNNNITCHECGTENEPQYTYCKNCGTPLKSEAQSAAPKPNNSSYGNGGYNNTYNQSFFIDSIEGVPTEDIVTFVGKKSYKIIPKFTKMELTGSKVSWNWPAAVLSYLFGPFGAAIWFFYRKMYKIAIIFAAIGIVTTSAVSLIAGLDAGSNTVLSQNNGNLLIEENYDSVYDILMDAINLPQSSTEYLANLVSSLINLATAIFTGILGYYFYKRFVVKSINRYRSAGVDPRYYQMGLASVGGTSSGMAVLGVVIMLVADELCSLIMQLI